MKTSDLIKCQILQNQVKSLMVVNNAITQQIDINSPYIHAIMLLQQSVNLQLDKYKEELTLFDDLNISDEDSLKLLGFTQS